MIRPLRFQTLLSCLLIACSFCLAQAASAGSVAYTLSVVPQYTTIDTARKWAPLLARIERDAGISLQLRLSDSTDNFEKELMAGLPDFAYINPYHAVIARKVQGYIPFLRSSKALQGILVVSRNSTARSLKDLEGGTIAFPSPNAFGASLFMRALLTEEEKLDFVPVYVSNHQNVYRHVLRGEAAAGGGVQATLAHEPEAARSQLRVIYTTPATPSHPIAAHPRVPASIRSRLAATLVKLQSDPEGQRLLADVELQQPRETGYAQDYAPLERLKLGHYATIGQR